MVIIYILNKTSIFFYKMCFFLVTINNLNCYTLKRKICTSLRINSVGIRHKTGECLFVFQNIYLYNLQQKKLLLHFL